MFCIVFVTFDLINPVVRGKVMKYNPVIINDKNLSVIEDIYLLAALKTFEPSISSTPFWNDSGKVVFRVEGPISDGMRRYFSGESAPLSAFTTKVKSLRNEVYAMRQGLRSKKDKRSALEYSPEIIYKKSSCL